MEIQPSNEELFIFATEAEGLLTHRRAAAFPPQTYTTASTGTVLK